MLSHIESELLPEIVQELIGIVGLQDTEVLIRERGGIRLYVPMKAAPDHWLAKLTSLQSLEKLVAVYAGEEFDLPRCEAALRAMREKEIVSSSESNATLARRFGYTERGIRKMKRRVEKSANNPQQRLFDD